MSKYLLPHLSDEVLQRRVEKIRAFGRRFTAWELAHIAEYDARRLFVPRGYPSMFSYCVQHLKLSEGAAYKRIHAGRAARQFPQIFEMIAAGAIGIGGIVERIDEFVAQQFHAHRSDFAEFDRSVTIGIDIFITRGQGVKSVAGFVQNGFDIALHADRIHENEGKA